MERAVFEARFRAAATQARDFAKNYLTEHLPDALRFRVRLNASYDGNPLHEDENAYPEDSSPERSRELSNCSADEVIQSLWRTGAVPEWVNVGVIGVYAGATLIEVMACGRYTTNEKRLYHQHGGGQPFQVHGPSFPIDYEDGDKFSVYYRATCWTLEELEELAAHADKVWSLDLHGPAFSDHVLAGLSEFPNLNILELHDSPSRGVGVRVDNQPLLRVLRIYVGHRDAFQMDQGLRSPALEVLTLHAQALPEVDVARLASAFPRLQSLTLDSAGELSTCGQWPRSMERLTLRAQALKGSPLPAVAESISLHLAEVSDAELEAFLAPVRSLETLSLRGSSAGDGLAEDLPSRFRLRYLDLVDTAVSEACLARIASSYPKMRMHPNRSAAT